MDEPHDPAIRPAMREAIATGESPVHIDVVNQRFRQVWSTGQIGARIRSDIDAVAREAGARRDGEWLHATDVEPTAAASIRCRLRSGSGIRSRGRTSDRDPSGSCTTVASATPVSSAVSP